MSRAENQARYEASEQGRLTAKRYQTSDKYKANRRRNAHKIAARNAVTHALEDGKLVRPNVCEHCNEDVFTEASHTDYADQLDVEWLCVPCHREKDASP